MTKNLINIEESDLDRPIYRIFKFCRLEELFQEHKLTLVKPQKWDDPFENFIFNSTGELIDGKTFTFGFRDQFYGQCWSFNKENDAMWRIYSPDKDGVKVKTTIRKLFLPLYETTDKTFEVDGQSYNISSFIGKVEYKNTKSLKKILTDTKEMNKIVNDQTGKLCAGTFYYKRPAFKHEKEVRIIYCEYDKRKLFDTYKFQINAIDLIDEIILDPRMSKDKCLLCKQKITSWQYTKK